MALNSHAVILNTFLDVGKLIEIKQIARRRFSCIATIFDPAESEALSGYRERMHLNGQRIFDFYIPER